MSEDDAASAPMALPALLPTPTALSSVTWPFEWSVETSEWSVEAWRTALERSLATQQAMVDGWASALEGRTESQARAATPARVAAWGYDVWAEAVQNALVHLDDAIDEEGVDLDALELIWLHALDDALTDVGETPEFGATMTESVERALTARAGANERRRDAVHAAGLPTDRDVEEVGRRLLALESRQKSIEDKLARVLDAVEAETAQEGEAAEAAADAESDVRTGRAVDPLEAETGAGDAG